MAWVRKRTRADGRTSYQVSWRGLDGKILSETRRTSRDARDLVHRVEADRARGLERRPAAGKITFAEFFSYFMQTAHHLRPSSAALYRDTAERHILPTFGAVPLGRITREDVKSWVAKMGRTTGAATTSVAYRLLRRVLNSAVDHGRIAHNPAARIRLPRKQPREPRFLSASEVARLADATPDRYRALVLVLAYGGLRIGEAAALRVGDVDLLRRRVNITRASVEVRGELVEGPTKGGRPRAVPLPGAVADALTNHIAAYSAPEDPEAPVFTGENGGVLRQSRFRSRIFGPAAGAAGLDPAPRVHDLRHTAVALAIQAGAHPKALQEMLGHASITTTLNQYGHLLPVLAEETAQRLDVIFREAGAKQGGDVVELRPRD